MSRAISQGTADTLRGIAERLAETGLLIPREGWWMIKYPCARAYVWAVYEHRDPVAALVRWMFGADLPPYGGDPAWCDLDRRHGSRTQWGVARAEALATLKLNIPVAERGA